MNGIILRVFLAGFFLPNLIGGLILGYVWQFIFNNAIPGLGKAWAFLAPLANPDNLILADRNASVLALVLVGTWQYAGYIMMIYVAALESIPVELHEAARIDGANGWVRLKNITIPMVAQAFTITMFLTLVNSFKQFDVNVSLTAGGPSTMFLGKPIFGTELLALDIYNTAFLANNFRRRLRETMGPHPHIHPDGDGPGDRLLPVRPEEYYQGDGTGINKIALCRPPPGLFPGRVLAHEYIRTV